MTVCCAVGGSPGGCDDLVAAVCCHVGGSRGGCDDCCMCCRWFSWRL